MPDKKIYLVREDAHKIKCFFLVVEPLRSGYPPPTRP